MLISLSKSNYIVFLGKILYSKWSIMTYSGILHRFLKYPLSVGDHFIQIWLHITLLYHRSLISYDHEVKTVKLVDLWFES